MTDNQNTLINNSAPNPALVRGESQFKNIRFVVGSFWGALALTFLCFITYQFDFLRRDFDELSNMLMVIWSGYFLLLLVVLTGLNKKLKDRTLATPIILWSTLTVIWVAYYIEELHLAVMMLYFSNMLQGAFRYYLKDYIFSASLAVLGYLYVIVAAFINNPDLIDLRYELIQWFAFFLLALGFVIINGEIGRIRHRLKRGNEKLNITFEKINELAITDELTGLYNRRHLIQTLESFKAIADRKAYGFSICFFDLDLFKTVNDDYGHHIGDEVLEKFADVLQYSISSVDCCARIGGEEFVVALVNKNADEAKVFSNGVRKKLQDIIFHAEDQKFNMTVSAGVTAFFPGEDVMDCLSRADKALYQAKDSGRDRVAIS